MKEKDRKIFSNRKSEIEERLASWPEGAGPVFDAPAPRYEISSRISATNAGGIGAIHQMVQRLGFDQAINENLSLLKIYLPYHESDHILNIVYNLMAGGTCLEDLEIRRHDIAYLNMLNASRIPDPTTAGDFLRRFNEAQIELLLDVINSINKMMWKSVPKSERRVAHIDADGSITPTNGEKKEGIGLSYKGIWGYNPLIVSLANFHQPLYIVNRSGNVKSSQNAAYWIDKAIKDCRSYFDKILVRGDTDFSQTEHLDRWSENEVGFVFGYDAYQNIRKKADDLPEEEWTPLERNHKGIIKTQPRARRENHKEAFVKRKEYRSIRLTAESVAEFSYQPTKCKNSYRMIVVRKDLAVERGEPTLIPNEIRYFFYITNRDDLSAEEVVSHSNKRCHQENLIQQLKNGVNALRVPVYDLNSNWAYMVIASLAWTFKTWFGLSLRAKKSRKSVLSMEFKNFLNSLILVPCQVIRSARQIRLRILAYLKDLPLLFEQVARPISTSSG